MLSKSNSLKEYNFTLWEFSYLSPKRHSQKKTAHPTPIWEHPVHNFLVYFAKNNWVKTSEGANPNRERKLWFWLVQHPVLQFRPTLWWMRTQWRHQGFLQNQQPENGILLYSIKCYFVCVPVLRGGRWVLLFPLSWSWLLHRARIWNCLTWKRISIQVVIIFS